MLLLSPLQLRNRLSSKKILLIFGVIFILSQAIIGYITTPLGTDKVLEVQTTFSAATFQQIIQDWRETDVIGLYFQHYIFDLFLHPIWYSIFLGAALALAMNYAKISAKYNWVILLPFIAGLGDVVENIAHLMMLYKPELISDLTVGISAFFTNGKWLLCFVSMALIGVWWVKGRLFNHQ